MDRARLTHLFRRYVAQQCTVGETQELMEFMRRSAHDETVKSLMDEVWQSLPDDNILPDDRAKRILLDILGEEEHAAADRLHISLWHKIAASIVVAVISGLGLYYLLNPQKDEVLGGRVEVASHGHQFVKLPDGSTVILNSGSRLEYPDSFEGMSAREVFLVGEGYFDITHHAQKPFIVYTGQIKTTVLGTAFNIKAYAEEKNITVAVTRGSVKVSDGVKDLGVITPNTQITFDKGIHQAEQQPVNHQDIIAWHDKDLFFDDVTLAEAAQQLEKRFGVKVLFSQPGIKDCRFTATFVKHEDLSQILEVICAFHQAHYQQDSAGNILLEGDGC